MYLSDLTIFASGKAMLGWICSREY